MPCNLHLQNCQLLFAFNNCQKLIYNSIRVQSFRTSIRELVTNLYLYLHVAPKWRLWIVGSQSERVYNDEKESKIREVSWAKLCYFSTRFDLRRGGQERSSCFPLFTGHLRSFPFPFVIVVSNASRRALFCFSIGFFTPFNLSPPLFVPGKSVNKSRLDKVSSTGLTNGPSKWVTIRLILKRYYLVYSRFSFEYPSLEICWTEDGFNFSHFR